MGLLILNVNFYIINLSDGENIFMFLIKLN